MIVRCSVTYDVTLDEPERWDHWVTARVYAISVDLVHIVFNDVDTNVYVRGRRRLKNGGLSVQDPEFVTLQNHELTDQLRRSIERLRERYDRSL